GVRRLHGSSSLTRPDALRSLGENSFLLIEGSGTLNRVSICGESFGVALIRGGFREPTSVTRVESTAWVSEGQLAFFFDPARRKSRPSLPLRIYAVPLVGEQTR